MKKPNAEMLMFLVALCSLLVSITLIRLSTRVQETPPEPTVIQATNTRYVIHLDSDDFSVYTFCLEGRKHTVFSNSRQSWGLLVLDDAGKPIRCTAVPPGVIIGTAGGEILTVNTLEAK